MSTDSNNRKNRIPENDPSKAMDSKKEVERSEDAKTDQDFPGYPHYPAREDIMDKRNDFHKENIDVENLPNSRNLSGVNQRYSTGQKNDKAEETMAADDDLRIEEGGDGDVDDDDLAVLNSTDGE